MEYLKVSKKFPFKRGLQAFLYFFYVLVLYGSGANDGEAALPDKPMPQKKEGFLPVLPEVGVGNPRAPLKVVVYHSLSCPACKQFRKIEFPKFKKKYVDTGRVYVVFKDFPIDALSFQLSKLVWCQRTLESHNHFEEILTENFSDTGQPVQVDWYNNGEGSLERARELLEKEGLPQKQAEKCLAPHSFVENAILQQTDEVIQKHGLKYAPGFLVGGRLVGEEESLEKVVQEELAKRQAIK